MIYIQSITYILTIIICLFYTTINVVQPDTLLMLSFPNNRLLRQSKKNKQLKSDIPWWYIRIFCLFCFMYNKPHPMQVSPPIRIVRVGTYNHEVYVVYLCVWCVVFWNWQACEQPIPERFIGCVVKYSGGWITASSWGVGPRGVGSWWIRDDSMTPDRSI